MKGYLGIDVSKGYADFILLSEELAELESCFQLDDSAKGHVALIDWITVSLKKHQLTELRCGLESTGGFEDNWFSLLLRLGDQLPVRVARLNPSVVKHGAKASLRHTKTDAISAENIASYLIRFDEQVRYQVADNKYRSYRSLYNHISLLNRQKTQLINELKQLLYTSFPELQRFCKSSIPGWVLELLKQYPSASALSKARPEKLCKIKAITAAKASQLIEKATLSVASRHQSTDSFLVKSMASGILQAQQQLALYKEHLEQTCQGPEVDLLATIKGVGRYSAAAIIIQIEDIRRFPSPKHLAGFFGLHPTVDQSSDKKVKSRMSKKGRPALRAALFMCANSAVLFDPHLKSIYARHRAKGNNHKAALVVIMHKLLRIIWGVLSHKKAYNSDIDLKNQQKVKEVVPDKNEIEEKRRLQDYDEQAPISRIETKKRKAYQSS